MHCKLLQTAYGVSLGQPGTREAPVMKGPSDSDTRWYDDDPSHVFPFLELEEWSCWCFWMIMRREREIDDNWERGDRYQPGCNCTKTKKRVLLHTEIISIQLSLLPMRIKSLHRLEWWQSWWHACYSNNTHWLRTMMPHRMRGESSHTGWDSNKTPL